MIDQDKVGSTKFEVAGRIFWEAHIFAPMYNSFTTNGFFDREGYQEPQLPNESLELALSWIIPIVIVLFILAIWCFIRRRD